MANSPLLQVLPLQRGRQLFPAVLALIRLMLHPGLTFLLLLFAALCTLNGLLSGFEWVLGGCKLILHRRLPVEGKGVVGCRGQEGIGMGTVRVWLLCNVAKNALFHRYAFLGPHVLHSDDPLNFPRVPSRPQFQPQMVERERR